MSVRIRNWDAKRVSTCPPLPHAPSEARPFSLSHLHHIRLSVVPSPRHGVSGRRRVRPPSPHLRRFPRSMRLQPARSQTCPRKRRAPHPRGHIGRRGRRDGFERRLRRAAQSRGQGIHNPLASDV